MDNNILKKFPESIYEKKLNEAVLAKYRDAIWFLVIYNQKVILSNLSSMQEKIIISENMLYDWFFSGKIELAFDFDININASFISCSQAPDEVFGKSLL